MANLLGVRAYARRRGVSHTAVQKAIGSFRLKDSVLRDRQGQVRIDADVADREWVDNTKSRRPTLTAAPPEPIAVGGPHGPAVPVATAADASPSPSGGPSFNQSRAVRDALLNIPHRIAAELAATTSAQIARLAVDSGFRTATVYNWSRRHESERVMAVKGASGLQMLVRSPARVDVNLQGERMRRGAVVWPVGVDIAKGEPYGALRLGPPLPGRGDTTRVLPLPRGLRAGVLPAGKPRVLDEKCMELGAR